MRSIAYLPRASDEDGVKGRVATAQGRVPLTPPADAGTPTITREDELPQSSIRARRRMG